MAEKKITKKEKNELLIAVLNGRVPTAEEKDMLIEHITHENELLARKASKSATQTPAQKDSIAIAELIKDILVGSNEGMSASALLKSAPIAKYVCYNGQAVSSQKLTNILTKLVESKDLTRTVVKKMPMFALNYGIADADTEGEED